MTATSCITAAATDAEAKLKALTRLIRATRLFDAVRHSGNRYGMLVPDGLHLSMKLLEATDEISATVDEVAVQLGVSFDDVWATVLDEELSKDCPIRLSEGV